jgi:O-antigen/teichoic acid export membrane protein
LLISIINFVAFTLPLNLFYLLFIAQFILFIDGNFKSITDTQNRSWQFTFSEFVSKILIAILLFLISGLNTSSNNSLLQYYIFIVLILSFFQLLIDLIWQKKYYGFTKPDLKSLAPFKKDIINLALIGLVIGLSAQTDKWFLKYFGFNEYVINGYINAYKLLELGLVIETILIPVMFSNLINGQDLNKPWKNFILRSKWFYLILFSGVISFIGFLIASYFIVPIIDAKRLYSNYSFDVIPFFGLILLFDPISYFLTQYLFHKNKLYVETITLVFYGIISLILYSLLIPSYGHIGAAISTLIGSIFIISFKVCFYWFYCRKN